jgi:acetyl esterase/lipase
MIAGCVLIVGAPLAAIGGAPKLDLTREQLELPYIQRHAEDAVSLSALPSMVPGSPVLVFFHGGGWTRGDKSELLTFGRRLASQGINVLLPNYRLAPDNLFPAQAEDAAAAVAWAVQHVKDLAADRKCIYVGGVTAGAHLAALLATHPLYLDKAKVKLKQIAGIIGVNGVYRITTGEGGATQEFLGSVFGFDDQTWGNASPIELVPRVTDRRLPPIAVIWNKNDDPLVVKASEDFVQVMQAAGQAMLADPRDGAATLDAVEPSLFDAMSQGACVTHREN